MTKKMSVWAVRLSALRGGILVIAMIAALSLLAGCIAGDPFGAKGPGGAGPFAKANTSGITSFAYGYDNSVGGVNYSYRVKVDASGQATFSYESLEHREYGEMSMPVGSEVIDGLESIYEDCKLAQWDGYGKYNPNVMDGDSFVLSIGFADGGSMSASGSNCEPDGFSAFYERMHALLSPLADQLENQYRQELIQRGITGNLDFIMAHFIQRGAVGSDEYEFFITMPGVRDCNFDVRVKSNGQFFPEGAHRYYCSLPVEAIDFAGVQALIEKYNLIEWYDWHETSKGSDYEWFQVGFGFDDGLNLNAMGSAQPERYEAFRAEFLQLMANMVTRAQQEYGMTEYE